MQEFRNYTPCGTSWNSGNDTQCRNCTTGTIRRELCAFQGNIRRELYAGENYPPGTILSAGKCSQGTRSAGTLRQELFVLRDLHGENYTQLEVSVYHK